MQTERLFTFASAGDAIRAERVLLDAGIPVKVMNLPSAIQAGCGLCLRVAPPRTEEARAALGKGGIIPGGLFTRTSADGQSCYEPYPGADAS